MSRWSAQDLATALESGSCRIRCDFGERHDRVVLRAPSRKRDKVSAERVTAVSEYLLQISLCGIKEPELEYRFDPVRQWRADFAWPDEKVLAEYEGGVFWNDPEEQGRHTRSTGFRDDCIKYSNASIAGWCLIRFTPDMVRSGLALQLTERALAR